MKKRRRSLRAPLRRVLPAVPAALALASCGGGGSPSTVPGTGGTSARLAAVEYGLLADVYGLDAQGFAELHQRDVMVAPGIRDERPAGSTLANEVVTYDFLSPDPDTLQPRLLITRELGAAAFSGAFDALDDGLRLVAPAAFSSSGPHSVAPRNGAFRLTFTHDLGLGAEFFVARNSQGQIVGPKNTEAVQLLEITGNPASPGLGTFRPVAVRVVPRGNALILDPVLLGSEGLQYQAPNSATGLPESPNQTAANMRIAIALEGPLAIPGVRPDRTGTLQGLNNSGYRSVIRDFRSGNRLDVTPDISKGFLRDPIPPRIVGQLMMYLERVDDHDATHQVVTVYKSGVSHELDAGDAIRLMVDNTGVPAAVTEITTEPADDEGQPAVQHVRALVRKQLRPAGNGAAIDVFQDWDPSDPTRGNQFWRLNAAIPPYPAAQSAREPWLVQYAPRSVLVAEFTAGDTSAGATRDDLRYFVTFDPPPLPGPGGAPGSPTENVSPHAAAVIRFTKPVDLATVRPLDTFFFGTMNLLDPAAEAQFATARGIEPSSFVRAKYLTPHLVGATRQDEGGSQTSLSLRPRLGFFLDDSMRANNRPYYLHVLGGAGGISDLAGNPLDFQQTGGPAFESLVIDFTLDARQDTRGRPLFPDNLAVSVARRFGDVDEDEQPSYYLPAEVQGPGAFNEKAYSLQDMFGAMVHLTGGILSARPTTRVRQVVDNVNQQPPPLQSCPIGQEQRPTTETMFWAPLQNPLNPFGCRLQTVWREIDMSLSQTNPLDFDLDVEQMFWAPFQATAISFDEFDRLSLFLSHGEWRPEPCVGGGGGLTMRNSGLVTTFDDNPAHNVDTSGAREPPPPPHAAYVDRAMTISPSSAVFESTGSYRFLQLPKFEEPYFVWRDQRSALQGGQCGTGRDTGQGHAPYILSPFLTGQGRFVTSVGGAPTFGWGAWDNRDNWTLAGAQREALSGGLVGAVALPLLADFWTYPDSETRPAGNPFRATGANGWQISLAFRTNWTPNFRAYTAGGLVQNSPKLIDPSSVTTASGGYTPNGTTTLSADNTVFWLMADYLKRTSLATAGFVEILDPHRMPSPSPDPRLGPFLNKVMPAGWAPTYVFELDPPLAELPGGTNLICEFRGAGAVDTLGAGAVQGVPWPAAVNGYTTAPDDANFPLDPLKAGDAGIRKFDDRMLGGVPRNTWTYFYNRNVTDYTTDPQDLAEDAFTRRFAGPNEDFTPRDVKYVNWRFVFENNVKATPAVAPVIDSFVLAYRLEKTN